MKNAYGNGYYANEEAKHETLTFKVCFVHRLTLSLAAAASLSLSLFVCQQFARIKQCSVFCVCVSARSALSVDILCGRLHASDLNVQFQRDILSYTKRQSSPSSANRSYSAKKQKNKERKIERIENLTETIERLTRRMVTEINNIAQTKNVLFSRFVKCLCKLEIKNVEL